MTVMTIAEMGLMKETAISLAAPVSLLTFEVMLDNQKIGLLIKTSLSLRQVWASVLCRLYPTQCRLRPATAAMFLRSCVAQALSRGDGLSTCYTLLS